MSGRRGGSDPRVSFARVSLTVWINGKFVERDAAAVSAFDAGLTHGVGLFETMLAGTLDGSEARIFRVERHMARLDRSARELGLSESLKPRALAELAEHVVEKSALVPAGSPARARVRLTVTGGDLNLLSSTGHGPVDPTVIIVAQPATQYPAEMFDKGVSAVVADPRANPLDPFQGHKTLDYWWRLRALQGASRKGAGETLILQVTNHICGGAVSNLFAVKDGALLTPTARGEEEAGAVPSPVLPGVARQAIIDAAGELRIGCARRLLAIGDVLDADEVFLTNSSWGVLPVVRVEGKVIGDGTVGATTRRLRQRWEWMVAHEP